MFLYKTSWFHELSKGICQQWPRYTFYTQTRRQLISPENCCLAITLRVLKLLQSLINEYNLILTTCQTSQLSLTFTCNISKLKLSICARKSQIFMCVENFSTSHYHKDKILKLAQANCRHVRSMGFSNARTPNKKSLTMNSYISAFEHCRQTSPKNFLYAFSLCILLDNV